jgi:hypothetical protein
MAARRRNRISEQFDARVISMLESPAYRVLSLSGRRALDRIAIEHAHHGGNDNGKLPVTYEQFMEYGIDRHAIAPAIRELEALGFIEVTQHGRPSAGKYRWPNLFRLTYVYCDKSSMPTHEWRKIKTLDEAELIARAARKASVKRRRYRCHTPEIAAVS